MLLVHLLPSLPFASYRTRSSAGGKGKLRRWARRGRRRAGRSPRVEQRPEGRRKRLRRGQAGDGSTASCARATACSVTQVRPAFRHPSMRTPPLRLSQTTSRSRGVSVVLHKTPRDRAASSNATRTSSSATKRLPLYPPAQIRPLSRRSKKRQ